MVDSLTCPHGERRQEFEIFNDKRIRFVEIDKCFKKVYYYTKH